jgi:TRAP-type transport system periplasmic protein
VTVTTAQDIPFVEALGASAVSQPVTVVNQNLANGVVDAILVDPSAALSFKLHEPANYLTTGYPSGGNPFVLLMNNGIYNSLSEEEQGWVDEASGKWLSMSGAKMYNAAAIKGIDVSRGNGVEIIELSDDTSAAWLEAMSSATDAWMDSDISQGLSGSDVAKLMKGE